MDDLLTQITGMTSRERKWLLSWVASLPEADVMAVFQSGVKLSYQIKDQQPELSGRICKYCAFIVAGRRAGWDAVRGKGYRIAGRKQYEDFSHLRKSKAADLISKGRPPTKRKELLAHWGEIKELKEAGNGFRGIAKYLKLHRKVDVSPSYLALLWKQVEESK
ncbi:MAG: hypothetical protein C0622_03240 [Desulfuromonas sp.]|nr:MAG: hypothetical protein C0622_03240 [Desulfuromonas sp.]